MSNSKTIYRFVFAAGGTGGHLYPAIAVAYSIKKIKPEAEILFIGTKHKLESRVVPSLGYSFKSILISGFSRKLSLTNLLFPFKLIYGSIQSLFINLNFKPKVAIGAGAYVSGPVLWSASILGSKILLMEQNSYPGITNRLLEKKAHEIHLSFEESKKYFRMKDKLKVTGNPIRVDFNLIEKSKAKTELGLDHSKKTLVVLGGSLGAKTLNDAVINNLEKFQSEGVHIILQCGKRYYGELKEKATNSLKIYDFIDDMPKVYSAADLVVARSGATTIAEIAYLGIPVIFVPSPNVAENHQYINAKSLCDENAAEMIVDNNLNQEITEKVISLINNENKLKEFAVNIKKFSKPNAAKEIAESAIALAETI